MYEKEMLHLVTLLLTSGCVTFCSQIPEYYLINQDLTWYDARLYCRTHYTDLATIRSQDDEMRLEHVTENASLAIYIWIGLMKAEVESWQWSAGETPTSHELAEYTNWAYFPNSTSNCGSMRSDGKWLSELCESTLPFVCQEGAESSGMFIGLEEKSWREAQDYCRLNNTELISVRSEAENQALQQLLNETDPMLGNWSAVWIGLFRDDWTWSDQSKSSLRYWKEFQPNNDGGCGAYDPLSKKWFDRDCTYKQSFVCYHENVKKHIVMVEIKSHSTFTFSDAAMSDSILTQIQKKYEGVKVRWRVQPDGKIFHKKEKKKIIEAC